MQSRQGYGDLLPELGAGLEATSRHLLGKGVSLVLIALGGSANLDEQGAPSLIPTAAEAGAITEVTVGSILPEGSLTGTQ